jgi:hypothetical protein
MSKRKYEKGKQVKSIVDLENADFIYIHNKIWHQGWWKSLQYRFLENQIEQGNVWLANNIRRK